MKINNSYFKPVYLVVISVLILFSCTSKPKIPVWEISKDGQSKSYLIGSSSYLSKADVDKMLTNKIILLFDSCETYLSLWDLESSNLVETKKWIEIGNNKTLKDTLSEQNFNLLKNKVEALNNESKLKFELPDNIKIKPQFYINDILNRNDNNLFNINQFFFKRAMPQNKNITGFISLQDYYKAYSHIDFEKYTSKLSDIKSLYQEKQRIGTESNKLYKDERFIELKNIQSKLILNPENVITDTWINKISTETAKQSSFILLDINYIHPTHEKGLYKKLLLKGYQLTRIN